MDGEFAVLGFLWMKFSRILLESYRFWPSEMSIRDAKFQGEGGFFSALSRAWRHAEACAEDWSEDIRDAKNETSQKCLPAAVLGMAERLRYPLSRKSLL